MQPSISAVLLRFATNSAIATAISAAGPVIVLPGLTNGISFARNGHRPRDQGAAPCCCRRATSVTRLCQRGTTRASASYVLSFRRSSWIHWESRRIESSEIRRKLHSREKTAAAYDTCQHSKPFIVALPIRRRPPDGIHAARGCRRRSRIRCGCSRPFRAGQQYFPLYQRHGGAALKYDVEWLPQLG